MAASVDAAQCAAEVLGGACGAVAATLMPGIVVLPSESAAATNLPEQVVRCILEILVRHRFAMRDEIGYVAVDVPPELIRVYRNLLKASDSTSNIDA